MSNRSTTKPGATLAQQGGWWRAASATAVMTIVLSLGMLRRGVAFGPDAWTYWSASVSLLDGRGYLDGHGLPVVDWPPLYSLWLAAVQAVFGVSVASVRLADALAGAACAGLLCGWLLRRTAKVDAPTWPVVVFSTSGVMLALRGCGSEYLMTALLFALLLAIEAWRPAKGPVPSVLAIASASISAAAMICVRHAALPFVPASCVLIAASPRSRPARVVAAVGIAGVAGMAWWGMRLWLGQSGTFALFGSDRVWWSTVWTMACGIDRELAPFPVGIVLFVGIAVVFSVASVRERASRWLGVPVALLRQADAVAFVMVALSLVLAMFQLVYVADAPNGRFVRFAALMLGGLAVGVVRAVPRRAWRWTLLLLLLLPNTLHAAWLVARGRDGQTTVTADGGESWLPANATLRGGVEPGTVLPDGRVVVAVPRFRWQQQRLDRGERR